MKKETYKLIVSNVGGIKGTQETQFVKNRLNILEGPNAVGKTSIIKGLCAVLGIDENIRRDGHDLWSMEAINLGLLPEKAGLRSGIINADAESAEVHLINDTERRVQIFRSGKIESSKNANPDFLLAGILSPNSWVYQFISSPSSMKESIFRKYITKLSKFADEFERAANILREYSMEWNSIINEVKRRKASLPNIKKEIKELKKEIKKLEDERNNIIKKIGTDFTTKDKNKMKDLLSKLKSLEEQDKEIRNSIGLLENEVQKLKNEIEEHNKKIKEKEEEKIKKIKEKEKLENEIKKTKSFNIDSLVESREKLQKERFKLMAKADLYYWALENLEEGKTQCPLCRKGTIEKKDVERNLNDIKDQIKIIDKKLKEIAIQIENHNLHVKRLKERMDELESEISEIDDEISNIIQPTIDVKKSTIQNKENQLQQKRAEREEITKKIKSIKEILGKSSPELIKQLDEISNMIEEKEQLKQRKEQELSKDYIEIYGEYINLDTALVMSENIVKMLNRGINYSIQSAEKIRKETIDRFNSLIGAILKRMEFGEFKRISLTKDYILNVQYTAGGTVKIIQPYALSESERVSVALVLLLALNKVFLKNTPFIIIDNMYEYFDEKRKEEILKILSEYAISEKVTIVLSRTSFEEKNLKARVYEKM